MTDQPTSQWVVSSSRSTVMTRHTQGTALTTTFAEVSVGSIVRALQEPLPSGLFRTSVETETPTDQSTTPYTSLKSVRVTATREVIDNAPLSDEPTMTDTTYGSLSWRKNEVGQFVGTKIVNTPNTSTGSAQSDAVIVRWKPYSNAGNPRELTRVWWRRDSDAYATLVAGDGAAQNDMTTYTWPGDTGGAKTLTHADLVVRDHENGAYDITQTLIDETDTTNVYWTKEDQVYTYQIMPGGLTYRRVTHERFIAMKSSESDAWNAIMTLQVGNLNLVRGTGSVVKKGRFLWRARTLRFSAATGYGDVKTIIETT